MKVRSASASLLASAMALTATMWSLRGVTRTDVVDTDAARHAMNGAFILDLVRHGRIFEPVSYAKWYFARYPAITIPYHPPGFPAFEAIFFALFGVKVFSARLAVAVTVGAAALLLFRLIWTTHRSVVLAFLGVAAFLLLPVSQLVASDVMLEFPAMVLAIASIYCLHLMFTTRQWRHSLAFALLGAAGIWTKQTVFLIPMPLLYIVLLRRWNLLRWLQVWTSVAILSLAGLALAAVGWSVGWSGISEAWQQKGLMEQLRDNFWFYLYRLRGPRVAIPLAALVAAWALHGLLRLKANRREKQKQERQSPERQSPERQGPERQSNDAIYVAWLIAVLLMLLGAPASNGRYLFFAYPAAMVLAFSMATQIAGAVAPRLQYAPAILATAWIAISALPGPRAMLSGPAEAASYLVQSHARRVLYCGSTDGNFMFSLRALDQSLEDSVIPCDKIPEGQARPETLPDFARRFDADYLVIERTSRTRSWDGPLRDPNLSVESVIPQHSSQPRFEGRLSIYRVYSGSRSIQNEFEPPISAFGTSLKPDF
jgi:Dolichyl-phosphate-mannose-protein mannosyltransferase